MCEYVGMPGIKWTSSTDLTDHLPGLVCSRLETPLPGDGYKGWATFWKLLRIAESLPP